MHRLIHTALDLIFPQKCAGCGLNRQLICEKCEQIILSEPPPRDYRWNKNNFNNLLIAANYKNSAIKKAIWMLKYRGVKKFAVPLADLIFKRHSKTIQNIQPTILIVPIPLSKKRLRERGYNQAELIAAELARKLCFPVYADILYKGYHTPSQVEIKNRKERLKNLESSFACRNAEELKNATVLLIDDIVTTGATLNEASKILKQNGAKKVIAMVVAKN
ncbi:MAG: hypothetical protein A2909_02180 [Candidatus Tagabacteria bacterium RIFCSPLOWO2_01_FULL_39_11]|uniref:Phosphoribosyltransferase domain-containing protein n=1 Tax=Candidatus Tagabacteria bacterium RIFCSPLOWO2_01_FULL_39_11 TaxID=1802295 RepID=A0A1G2LMZ9_9BACT|nr:MAG: hypothetical protein A2909_02180 [Candidatus Tagabacteria bacterium RIFCSPLOWO2_01_FULL_39_11]